MKHFTTIIAAGLALVAFTPPAAARPAGPAEAGVFQLAKHSKHTARRGTPPGWSKGNKNGWNGKPMPPGQWKKFKKQQQHNRWDRNDRYRRYRTDRYDWRDRFDRDHRRTSDRWDGRRYRS